MTSYGTCCKYHGYGGDRDMPCERDAYPPTETAETVSKPSKVRTLVTTLTRTRRRSE